MSEICYKGFSKGLICKGKQYKENEIVEEKKAVICKKGIHYCKNPMDVLDYYGFVGNNGEFNEFATVEPLDIEFTDDNKKFCCKKVKIGAEINFKNFLKICIDFVIKKTISSIELPSGYYAKIGSSGYSAKIGSSGDYAQIGSSGNYAQIGSSGYSAQIGSSGNYAQIGSSGNYALIGSSGNSAQICSSGDHAQICSSGDSAKIGSSGYSAQIGSSGYSAKIGSSGDHAKIGSSGDSAQIGSSGDSAQIGSSGNSAQIGSSGDSAQIGSSGNSAQIGSSGDSAQICSSGNSALIDSSGMYAVIMCAGHKCIARAKKGSFITLAEWTFSEKRKTFVPINVKTRKVDGKHIKEDTYYKLVNGKFVEVQEGI